MSAERPEVLFVCVHNAGRSQMAAGLLHALSGGRVRVRSAGSEPAAQINPAVVAAMDEVGIDLAHEFPKPLTDAAVAAADVVITMGCGDACPIYPGKRYLDWQVDDPAGQPLPVVRRIRDEIRARVEALLREFAPRPAREPGAFLLRPARLSDAAAIAHIYNQGIEDRVATFETEPRSTAQLEETLRARGERYPTVVAERDGRVVAWAGAAPYSDRPCYAGIGACSVYVERESRGGGAGRAVLAELIGRYHSLGFWKLTSRIFPENRASRAMCKAEGFREVGVYYRHGQLDGRWRDCVIVERLLDDDAAR